MCGHVFAMCYKNDFMCYDLLSSKNAKGWKNFENFWIFLENIKTYFKVKFILI